MTQTHAHPGFDLHERNGRSAAVLQDVHAHLDLQGPLAELVLRQRFRNDSERNLEVVYSFPLPAQAVLMGLATELNRERRTARVLARAKAEAGYEKALDAGDAPVMLETLADGVHSLSIGNLQPGDELCIELRLAQWLLPSQGRLRLVLPCAIAPRYGDPAAIGVQPQQLPHTQAQARYPLALSIHLGEPWNAAQLQSPTHALQHSSDGHAWLAPGALLDRDLVLLLPATATEGRLWRAQDSASPDTPELLLAQLTLSERGINQPVRLQLLLDCSGSMQGAAIASTRRAALGLLDALRPEDQLSVSCFGSSLRTLQPLSAPDDAQARLLRTELAGLQADMGGTDLATALDTLWQCLAPGQFKTAGHDVLLITDGQIWEVDPLVRASRARLQRLFIIGVGLAPAEGGLRQLANATGGACEFATPGEDLERAAARMLKRMRQRVPGHLQLHYEGAQPVWESWPEHGAFDGETLLLQAAFAPGQWPQAVRITVDGQELIGQPRDMVSFRGDTPARLAAHARLADLPEARAASMALRYQLLTEQTHCLLVHERCPQEQAQTLAELHRVAQMQVPLFCSKDDFVSFSRAQIDTPSVWRMGRPAVQERSLLSYALLPSLTAIQDQVVECLLELGGLEGLAIEMDLHLAEDQRHPALCKALKSLNRLGLTADEAWLALALWVQRDKGLATAAFQAEPLASLQNHFDARTLARLNRALVATLGQQAANQWTPTRSERLMSYLARLAD